MDPTLDPTLDLILDPTLDATLDPTLDPTVLCLPKDTPKVRNTGRNARHFFVSLSVCLYLFVEFVCPRVHVGGHFGYFGCPGPHLDPRGPKVPEI